MAARVPKKNQFTALELDAITQDWHGDSLKDGGGLFGKVKVLSNEKASETAKPVVKITWEYSFRWMGKVAWFYCGQYPNKSMKEIRAARDKAKQFVADGVDPRQQKKIKKIEQTEKQIETLAREEKRKSEALTVNDLFDHWVIEGVRRKDNNKGIKAMFNNHLLPSVGQIALKSLTEQELIGVYKKLIKAEKFKTTIELHKDVSQMLKWASDRKPYRALLIEGNPAVLVDMNVLIPKDYTNVRDRVLSEEEITRLSKAFESKPVKKSIELAVWISLSCSCRIGELLKSEWKHIDFEAQSWFIPAENSKGHSKRKTDHTVYLSNFALDKFRQLKELADASQWCFPAMYKDGHVVESSFSKLVGDRQLMFMNRQKKLKNRVENNALVIGDEVWTMHDLRRTSATMIQKLYPSARDGELISQLCLHHSVLTGAAVHYLHHQYVEQMREAWFLLGARLEQLTSNRSIQ